MAGSPAVLAEKRRIQPKFPNQSADALLANGKGDSSTDVLLAAETQKRDVRGGKEVVREAVEISRSSGRTGRAYAQKIKLCCLVISQKCDSDVSSEI
ncbi:Protein of unknown function [Gryllus bimaculatus]|nr:Protein of unknown function [Gryllus bimaculatus]